MIQTAVPTHHAVKTHHVVMTQCVIMTPHAVTAHHTVMTHHIMTHCTVTSYYSMILIMTLSRYSVKLCYLCKPALFSHLLHS